ncbi:MAG: hypothetical protein ACOH1R_03190 [Luteimonas sp.]
MQQSLDMAKREALKVSEALLLCQRELAQVRGQEEPLQEECSQLRTESIMATATAAYLAQALANHLSDAFWEEREPATPIRLRRFIGSRWPWLRKLFGSRRSPTGLAEDEQIRLIEASPLFQPAWYLQQHSDVALAGINPAAHYLYSGARELRDPGPGFSTRDYVARHPEIEQGGCNPLVHHLQTLG